MGRGNFVAGWIVLISCWAFSEAILHLTTDQEWANYKRAYGKDYSNSAASELYARYYYNYNLALINQHNNLYNRGQRSFMLRANQFTDMKQSLVNSHFAKAAYPAQSNASPLSPLGPALPSFDPITNLGLNVVIEDQGTVCNSGWAYAAAKGIELMAAMQMGNLMQPNRYSAQNLIDCAGRGFGCINQAPEQAFQYLATFKQDLYQQIDYQNKKNESTPGMCVPDSGMPAVVINLGKYSTIADGDDEKLKQVLSNEIPVVVEVNPASLEFINYGGGIYVPVKTRTQASHFMVVLGYGTQNGTDYWLLLNSFGTTWGEKGLMKWKRDPLNPITKKAIFPTEFA